MTGATQRAEVRTWSGIAWSPAERQLWHGVGVMTTVGVLFFAIQVLERAVLRLPPDRQLVGNVSATAMRYWALPHVIIGFLFLVTARANRSAGRQLRIWSFVLLAAALCALYGLLGGAPIPGTCASNPTLLGLGLAGLTYLLFLVHELRDETFIFVSTQGLPNDVSPKAFGAVMSRVTALVVIGTAVVMWVWALLLAPPDRAVLSPVYSWPCGVRLAAAVLPAIAWLAGIVLTARSAKISGQPVDADLWRTLAPVFRLFAVVLIVLTVALVIVKTIYPLILLHVSVWYAFICHRLDRAPARPGLGWWSWCRSTATGFQVLYLGTTAVVLGLGLVWLHVFDGHGALSLIVSPAAFVYWTVAHIIVTSGVR